MNTKDVIAVVDVSSMRRVMGVGALYGLGAVILYTVFVSWSGLGAVVFGLILAAAAFAMAERLRQATKGRVLLTKDALVDDAGTVLIALDEIAGVDRGILAFKPSNGFVLTLKSKQPRGWAPGLWWRFGRFLGVGGAVSAGQTKFMAEQIVFALDSRAAGSTRTD